MFKGYNLDLSKEEHQAFLNVGDEDIINFDREMEALKEVLQSNIGKKTTLPRTTDNKIDGSKLINDWFPSYEAQVFISHSHLDTRTAKRLACWLKNTFNLTTFIDSTIWGSADELLNRIDNKYSVLRKDKDGTTTYNYKTRNYTTSHVHMMLSTALVDIMNSTECIIFLNTPASLAVNEVKDQKTNSPWIYNELKIASIIEKKHPREKILRTRFEKRASIVNEKEKLEILYPVNHELAIFDSLEIQHLEWWADCYDNSTDNSHPLDILYFKNKL